MVIGWKTPRFRSVFQFWKCKSKLLFIIQVKRSLSVGYKCPKIKKEKETAIYYWRDLFRLPVFVASCILGETEFQQVERFSVQKLSESLQTPRGRGRSAGVVQPSCPSYSILSGFRGAGQRGKVGPGLVRHTCVWLLFVFFNLATPPTLKKRLCCENTQLCVLFSLSAPSNEMQKCS